MLEIVVFTAKDSTINNFQFPKVSDKILHGYCQIILRYFLQILFKSVDI